MKGLIVKDYRIIDAIGKGGMATVYLAEHQLLGNKVAIKILHAEFVRNKNIRSRFIAEAKNMARMSHTNIIKVTDLVDDGDLVAFVMEYMEGQTLKEYLGAKAGLSDDEIKKLFVQMLDAVGYVHEQDLVHRDIKPSNFMIDNKGKVKLIDFGIAKTLDPNSAEYTQTGTGIQMGTPMFMSPEQITETKSVTAQSDIYSLGVLLWQMVAGQKPYDTKTLSNFQMQTMIVHKPLGATNTHWDNVIQKATVKDASKRFENCEAFKSVLTNANLKIDETIVVDIHESTIIDSINRNDSYQNTKLPDLHIDYFFPLKVKDCFTRIFNELQSELKHGIDWDVPLGQIDYYNYYVKETIDYDFGIVGFSKNQIDFYFAYYCCYHNSNTFDYDFVFPTHLGWVKFSNVNSFENRDLIQNVLVDKSDNDLLNFILEIILRVKKTDCYTKLSEYKKFCEQRNLEFGSYREIFSQWFNATDLKTRSIIKWDVSTTPWDDISEWESHIAFQFKEYVFCIGNFNLNQEWSISVYSRNDLKIYSLISLAKDNMNVFKITYSLPSEITEFIFNLIRKVINWFGIVNNEEEDITKIEKIHEKEILKNSTFISTESQYDHIIIRMPLLGDTMKEGKIVKWHKKVGDYVKSDDVLADVETDKATMEVVGYAEGILLQRRAEEGEFLKVNDIIAIIKKKC